MILIKIHKTKFRDVIAVCDSNLVGKKFEENGLQLDITDRFYKGNNLPEEDMILILKTADNVNIVGQESIGLAIKAGIVDKNNILIINGIPHAQYATIE